jgi:phage major head subunit gpT-like protein
MPVDVSAFTAMARAEFMQGKMAADDKPFPANYEAFTTRFPSTVRVETHTYMSNLPRLKEFNGYSPATRLVSKPYTVENKEYRIGPVTVRKTDLDDDQVGGYLRSVNALPGRAQKDIGHLMLKHLADGTSTACFDGTNFFANSHAIGSGDNLDTANFASNDGVTHRVIALVLENPAIKPIVYQDREKLGGLMTDAETPQAAKLKEYEYWADTRFGRGYGFWWDAYHVTITDTPTVAEVIETLIPQIVNGFRSFTLPKGDDVDDSLYVHEGWVPNATNFHLLCNLKLAEVMDTALNLSQYIRSTGNVDNQYKGKATVVPTSALGA